MVDDKRPWLMDALLEIGHNVADITHIREKEQYLQAELKNIDDPNKITEISDKLADLREIRQNVYKSYDLKASYICNQSETKEGRCMLKHAAAQLVFAMELDDSLDNSMSFENLNTEFDVFAGTVSFVLGIEFHSCLRCIFDGIKRVSEEISLPLDNAQPMKTIIEVKDAK